MTSKKPNILYLHSHDTGRYIQPYGHAIATPALQKLAEQGVLFRHNFCINPTCSPSRAALVVGNYPHENGMTGLAHRGFSLNDYGQHIVHTLRKAGYVSALTGVQHIAHSAGDSEPWRIIGYDKWLGNDGVKGAEDFFRQLPEQPFFLSVGFGDTHRTFPKIEECADDPRYCLPPAPIPDTPESRQDMVRYKAAARKLDEKMGRVLALLDASGAADNTLVICTTDHGIAFPRMKCNLHDSGIGVMLMMRGPGGFSGGKVVDEMVTHLDIYPTICEVAGADKPAWLRGESLLPLVSGEKDALHEALFFEVNYHAAYEPMRAVRTKRWKYIRRFDGRSRPVLCNCDNGESKSIWLGSEWKDMKIDQEMLYDLSFDPNEMNNLAGKPEYAGIVAEMKGRMDRWMKDTNDPLLAGPLALPAGGFANDADDVSPAYKKK
jgi:N-sulfoglucosamine sulfohydrolase